MAFRQARLNNLTNRLGFVVDLAKRVAERQGETDSPRYLALTHLSERLRQGRLNVRRYIWPGVADRIGTQLAACKSAHRGAVLASPDELAA